MSVPAAALILAVYLAQGGGSFLPAANVPLPPLTALAVAGAACGVAACVLTVVALRRRRVMDVRTIGNAGLLLGLAGALVARIDLLKATHSMGAAMTYEHHASGEIETAMCIVVGCASALLGLAGQGLLALRCATTPR